MSARRLRISLLVLLLVVAVVLCFIVSTNQLLASYKDELEQLLSEKLSSSVRFSRLRVQLYPLPQFRIDHFQLADKDECRVPFRAETIGVRFDLYSLLQKKLAVSSVTVISPSADLSSDSRGIRSSPRKDRRCPPVTRKKEKAVSAKDQSPEDSTSEPTDDFALAIALKEITIKGGDFRFRAPGLSLLIPKIDFSARVPLIGKRLERTVETVDQEGYLHLSDLAQGFSLKTRMSLRGTRVAYAGDEYRADLISGPVSISYSTTKGTELKGKLLVEAFAYGFEGFSISQISGELNKIVASVSRQADVAVDLELDGKSILLEHPAITISSVRRVQAPLRIRVPTLGGYEVSGPVTVDGAEIQTIGRDFKEVSSTVQMLVSDPKQEYSSDKLAFHLDKQPLETSARVTITPEACLIRDSELVIGGGRVAVSSDLLRDGSHHFSGNLEIHDTRLAELVGLFNPGYAENFSGTLKALNAEINGQSDQPMETLSGKGSFLIEKGLLKDEDALKDVFEAVKKVPSLQRISAPSKVRDSAEQKLKSDFQIKDRQLHFSNTKLTRPRFTMYGEGVLGFDKRIDYRAKLVLFQETAGSLGLGVESLKRLFGAVAKISVPLLIEGKLPEPSISVEMSRFVSDSQAVSLVGAAVDSVKNVGQSIGESITGSDEKEEAETVNE